MAEYTSEQLYGPGCPCEELSGNTTFSITSSNDQVAYFTMETVRNGIGFYDSSSATNALGVYSNLVNVTTLITSSYIASLVVGVGGGSFDFEPTDTIALSGSFFRGTGGISLNINGTEPIVIPTPILYYDPSNLTSYPGSGSTVFNITGSAPNGTLTNVTFTDPYFTYNGTTSTIAVADSAVLEPGNGDWTVEIWVNPETIGTGKVLIGKTDTGLASGWGYGIRLAANGNTYMEVGNGITSISSPTSTLSTGSWYQVVGVWSNVDSNFLGLYINGEFIGSNSHSFTSIKDTTSPLYIGSFNGGQFNQWFNGDTGIVRIYNTALTADQVLQAYNNDKAIYEQVFN
jgi:hypothetical protein